MTEKQKPDEVLVNIFIAGIHILLVAAFCALFIISIILKWQVAGNILRGIEHLLAVFADTGCGLLSIVSWNILRTEKASRRFLLILAVIDGSIILFTIIHFLIPYLLT